MRLKTVVGPGPLPFGHVPLTPKHCNARKGHEIVAPVFSKESTLAHGNRRSSSLLSAILFFVRVNQVLVRLWARAISSVRRGVVVFGQPTAEDRPLVPLSG
jgi:hypothetical protein